MITPVTIPLSKKEHERLARLALRYGLSLPKFSRLILQELASEIPEESLEEYEHPERVRASFTRALRDYRAGRVHAKL